MEVSDALMRSGTEKLGRWICVRIGRTNKRSFHDGGEADGRVVAGRRCRGRSPTTQPNELRIEASYEVALELGNARLGHRSRAAVSITGIAAGEEQWPMNGDLSAGSV